MKSAGTVRHKLTQVRFRYLKKRLEMELQQAPGNCRFNAELPDDGYSICVYGAESTDTWVASYCDVRIDQGARAQSCSTFCHRRSKEQIKEEFGRELNAMSLPEVAARWPDMAALIWVLDGEEPPQEVESAIISAPTIETQSTDAGAPAASVNIETVRPWWKRLLAGEI